MFVQVPSLCIILEWREYQRSCPGGASIFGLGGMMVPCGIWGGGGRDCRTGGKQPGRKMDMRNLFAQEGRGFPSYQQFWLVHPEISAGYVGVSYSSLECVHAHESRPTLPLQRHIAKKFITVQTVVSLGTAPICLPGVG